MSNTSHSHSVTTSVKAEDASFTAEQEAKVTQLLTLMTQFYTPLPQPLLHYQKYFPRPADAPTLQNPVRYFCVTFLQSREWHVEKAFAMMKEVVVYRDTNKLDEKPAMPPAMSVRGWDCEAVRTTLGQPLRPTSERIDQICRTIQTHYATGLHYWDRGGRPVLYMMLGSVDEEGLLRSLREMAMVGQTPHDLLWEMVQYMNVLTEAIASYQLLQVNAASGLEAHECSVKRAVTVVVDLTGFSFGMLWQPAMNLYKSVQKESFKYYPDAVEKIVVTNAPNMVMFAYNLVKPIMPDAFLQKVHIVKPKDTFAALTAVIDPDHIPSFLGGRCTCSAEGGCLDSYPTGQNSNDRSEHGEQNQESGSVTSCHGVKTEDIHLSAGHAYTRGVPLQPSDSVHWNFAFVKGGANVVFTTYFVPQSAGMNVPQDKADAKKLEPYVLHSAKVDRGENAFTATVAGTFVLTWRDATSWFASSHLQLQIYTRPHNRDE